MRAASSCFGPEAATPPRPGPWPARPSPTPSSRRCPLPSYHPDAFVPSISVHIGAIVCVSGGPILPLPLPLPLTPIPTPYPQTAPARTCTRCSPSRARSGRSRRRASSGPGAAGPWRGAARPRSAGGARGVSPRRRIARQSPRSEGSTTPLPRSEVRGALGVDRLTDYRRSVRGNTCVSIFIRAPTQHLTPPHERQDSARNSLREREIMNLNKAVRIR